MAERLAGKVAIVSGALYLGEAITLQMVAGCAVVLAGTELNISGCLLAWCTCSNVVSAQCPGPVSKPGSLGTSKNLIGASRRSVANAPSRRSSSRDQKRRFPRSTSSNGTSGGGVPFWRLPRPALIVVVMRTSPDGTENLASV